MNKHPTTCRAFVLFLLTPAALLSGCQVKNNSVNVANSEVRNALTVRQQSLPQAAQSRAHGQSGGSATNTVQPQGGPYLEVTTYYKVGLQPAQPLAGITAVLATKDGRSRQEQQTDSQGVAMFASVPVDCDIEIRFGYCLSPVIPGRYWISRKPADWPRRLTSQTANSNTVVHLRQTIHHWPLTTNDVPVLQPKRTTCGN